MSKIEEKYEDIYATTHGLLEDHRYFEALENIEELKEELIEDITNHIEKLIREELKDQNILKDELGEVILVESEILSLYKEDKKEASKELLTHFDREIRHRGTKEEIEILVKLNYLIHRIPIGPEQSKDFLTISKEDR